MPLRKRLLWFLVLLTIGWAVLMQIEMSGYVLQPAVFGPSALDDNHCQHTTQVIGDLELARNETCFSDLIAPLGDWTKIISIDRNTNLRLAELNTDLDLVFIPLYWLTFLFFACYYWPSLSDSDRGSPWFRRILAGLVVAVITIAAIYDYREDFLLFGAFPQVAQGHVEFALSFPVSRVKWELLGIATALLGLFPLRDRGWLLKVLGLLLILSGIAIDIGTVKFSNPNLGMKGLVLALLIALIAYFPWGMPATFTTWLICAYLLRFQILSGLVLAFGLPLGYFLAPSIFLGLFDAIAPFSFFLMCFAALLLAMIVMITTRLTLAYGPERFPDLAKTKAWTRSSWRPTCLFALLAIPVIVLTSIGTQSPLGADAPKFSPWEKLGEILLAAVATYFFLFITAEVHSFLEDPDGSSTACFLYPPFRVIHPRGGTPTYMGRTLAESVKRNLPLNLQAGILRLQRVDGSEVPVIRSGHRLAAIAFLGTLVLYFAVGIWTNPASMPHGPAAMFYVLFLLCLLTWFLTGVAFFLDRVRVPVLTTLIVLSLLASLGGGTDHVYELVSPTQKVELLGPTDVIYNWVQRHGDPGAPIVVVATAGGGIRASAWTTQVLTGLAEGCQVGDKNKFTSSVVLISSVSGGSEGAMYFAGWYDSEGNTDLKKVKEIRDESAQTDLGAVGWGLVYPDLLRTIPGVALLNHLLHSPYERIDRGWALEQQWNQHWVGEGSSPRLGDWYADVKKGTRPALIFNATVAESGERFVAATTDLYEQKIDQFRGTVQFFHSFEGQDLPVSTAARLSATFPFVSPMTRADTGRRHEELHVGDGGYYDNSGLLSATQWLAGANMTLQDHPVILVVIDSTPGSEALGQYWAWQRQFVAPLTTLLNVRTSSQQLRAHYEKDLVQDLLEQELGSNPPPITSAYFEFQGTSTTPLSWHLRPDQLKEIGDQWRGYKNSDQAKKVYTALDCNQ